MIVKATLSKSINDLISAQRAEASAMEALQLARNEVDRLESCFASTAALSAAVEAADNKAIQLLAEMINHCNIMARSLMVYAATVTEGPEQEAILNALDKLYQMREIFSDVKSEYAKI